jgi:UDP:flavonoid glycosyltransferase YjiC (YdhE family)
MVGVGVIPFTLASADTAPFGLGLPPDSSKEGRARNREMYEFMQGEVLAPAQALYTELLTGLGVTETPPFFLDATILKADRFLQLAIEELSYKRTDTPEHVRFVGTLAGVRPEGIALPGWWPDVQAADAVVVVTQGTVANKDFADLIEPTLEALADLPVLTVAATGRSGAVRKVPSNARVAEFIPFDVLLPHADVLVTNGGFGAVQQALRNGTPLVVAGTTEDKREGNARTAATGAAINLAVDRPEPAQIRTAVQTVLAEPGYLKHAERLAAEYAATDALGAIARTVEELGR